MERREEQATDNSARHRHVFDLLIPRLVQSMIDYKLQDKDIDTAWYQSALANPLVGFDENPGGPEKPQEVPKGPRRSPLGAS